jgi:sugar-specific transcriptional regulator TrmB
MFNSTNSSDIKGKSSEEGKVGDFDEEDTQTLVNLGLNGSQAKIYLALISLGVANAKKIAQTAGIDGGEVYRQLESLQKKGLVEKILNTPNQYKSMALNEALELLVGRKNREDAKIRQKIKVLLRKGDRVHEDALKEEEAKFSIIASNEYRIRRMTKVHDWIEKEILWFTQIERVPVSLTIYYEAMKKASARGVRWRAIAELNKKPTDRTLEFIKKFKEENPYFDLRFSASPSLVTFSICDDRELFFSTAEVKGAAGSKTLCTNNPQLIRLTKEYFELKWNTAIKEYPINGVTDN